MDKNLKAKLIMLKVTGVILAIILGVWVGSLLKERFIDKKGEVQEYVFDTSDLDNYVDSVLYGDAEASTEEENVGEEVSETESEVVMSETEEDLTEASKK